MGTGGAGSRVISFWVPLSTKFQLLYYPLSEKIPSSYQTRAFSPGIKVLAIQFFLGCIVHQLPWLCKGSQSTVKIARKKSETAFRGSTSHRVPGQLQPVQSHLGAKRSSRTVHVVPCSGIIASHVRSETHLDWHPGTVVVVGAGDVRGCITYAAKPVLLPKTTLPLHCWN